MAARPSYAPAYRPSLWQGLYGGLHAGYGWSGDAEGAVGGAQVGYNWQSQQFVYGIEGDITLSDIGIRDRRLWNTNHSACSTGSSSP